MQSIAKVMSAVSGGAAALHQAVLPSTVVATSFSRSYHKNVVDHYENPRNVGSFAKSDANVGTGEALSYSKHD